MGRTLNIKGQKSGMLEAVRPSHKEPRKGVFWDCVCSGPVCKGKGKRKVLAKDFRQKKIKRCIQCADPVARSVQAQNAPKRWSKRPTGPMYPDAFRKAYKQHLKGFNYAQRMLFDLMLDGRKHWQHVMQVVDLVMRSENVRLDIELLVESSPERWKRYLERQRFRPMTGKQIKTELSKRAA